MIMVSRFLLSPLPFPLFPPCFSLFGRGGCHFLTFPPFFVRRRIRGRLPPGCCLRPTFVPIPQFVCPHLFRFYPPCCQAAWFEWTEAIPASPFVQALRCVVRAALCVSRRCLACRCMESRPLIPLPLLPCRGVRGSDRPGPCWVRMGQCGSTRVRPGQRRSRRFRSVQTECVTFKRIACHLSPIASGSFQIISGHNGSYIRFKCEKPPVWIIFSPRVWPRGVGREMGRRVA